MFVVAIDACPIQAWIVEPQIVPERKRWPAGFDEAVISSYAKG